MNQPQAGASNVLEPGTTTYTRPFTIFLLMLPSGISSGFVFVTLPYVLTHHGFTVVQTAGIVAVGASANLFRFVMGPIVDVSLSLRKWYFISTLAIVATLLLLSVTPLTVKGISYLTMIVFISQLAGNMMLLPIGAFMAKRIEPGQKGRASGFYQAGSLAGNGIGGGAGLWLANHLTVTMAGMIVCAACAACSMIVLTLQDIEHDKAKRLVYELKSMGRDLISMLMVPVTLFVVMLIIMPIGTGAMANLWSAMAEDWKVDANTVALITGILSGLVSMLGCLFGGYIADRRNIWIAYLGSGVACAFVTMTMALMPMRAPVYIVGVLFYAFTTGMIYAAFTAVLLFAIGKRHVATKFSLMGSLGNISVVYMTTVNGWMHDHFNSRYMLIAEALIGIVFVIIFYGILKRLHTRNLIPASID